MSGNMLHLVAGQGVVETATIAPDRIIEGAPITETRLAYQRGDDTFVGEWSCGVGAWRVSYDEWEFCHMLEGACELTPDGGAPQQFGVGDSFVIEPGFRGVWRVLQPMRKRFVVRTFTS